MNPAVYLDIEISFPSFREEGSPNIATRASIVMGVLHGAFKRMPGRFAVAFPATSFFKIIRVFADNRDELDSLQQAIEDHEAVKQTARLKSHRIVPAGFNGPWVTYARYRIPTRKADRTPAAQLRARRIRKALDEQLPYFQLASKSQGTSFSLHVTTSEAAELLPGDPDSYGLATASNLFSLPVLPV
jgi:hypothetical protein